MNATVTIDESADPGNIRWASKIAYWMAAGHELWMRDEFRSAALEALVVSARRYDPDQGTTFRQFALRRIQGAVQDCRRSLRLKGFRRRHDAPFLASLSSGLSPEREEKYQGDTLGDMIPSGDLPVGWEIEAIDEVIARLRPLPRTRAEAMRLQLTVAGMDQQQIGQRLGVSQSRIFQILRDGLQRLRQAAEGKAQ
jgi:RNA polymerase sigma factor (sigma-70 family)